MKRQLVPAGAGPALPLWQSEVIPGNFAHGFTSRESGTAPADELFNLALRWGQDQQQDRVRAHRARLLAALHSDRLFMVNQVHGAEVVTLSKGDDPQALAAARADALVSAVPGAAIGVFVADCVPVLLADPVTGGAAAIHAGWRGVVAQVVSAAVAAMAGAFSSRPADLRVALGPAIGRCCFEVGPEVVTAFAGIAGRDLSELVQEIPGARPHIDLRRALRRELEGLGVPADQIDEGQECTRCDGERRFFSYRRDGRSGQQMAVIVPPR